MYLDVGKSSYVRLVSCIFPLILQQKKQINKSLNPICCFFHVKQPLIQPTVPTLQVINLVCVCEVCCNWHQTAHKLPRESPATQMNNIRKGVKGRECSALTPLRCNSVWWTSTWITQCTPTCSPQLRQDTEQAAYHIEILTVTLEYVEKWSLYTVNVL